MENMQPSYTMIDEKGSLLGSEEEGFRRRTRDIRQKYLRFQSASSKYQISIIPIIIHTILAAIWVGSLIATIHVRGERCAPGPSLIPSPAREAVQYERWFMNNTLEEHNSFKGVEPSLEQTNAWRGLLNWQAMVVSEDDLRAIGRLSETSVKFEDGSGYFAELDVYHQLHCLNYIREFIHGDYYQNDETVHTQGIHVDHCIDTLRQIAMCHADISLVTYNWVDGRLMPYPNFSIERECRNWESIENYAKEHQPNFDFGEGLLRHPSLGPVPFHKPRHPDSE